MNRNVMHNNRKFNCQFSDRYIMLMLVSADIEIIMFGSRWVGSSGTGCQSTEVLMSAVPRA